MKTRFYGEDDDLFERNTAYGLGTQADWQFNLREHRNYGAEVVLLGASLNAGRKEGVTTLQVKSNKFYDDEHDSCHILSLDFIGLRPTYAYGSVIMEGMLVSGSWYTDPETLTADDLWNQHGKNPDGEAASCAEVFVKQDGVCPYQIEGEHYAWLPYTAPNRLFTPRHVELTHQSVIEYAVGGDDGPETEPTRFWREIDQKAYSYTEDSDSLWIKEIDKDWRKQ